MNKLRKNSRKGFTLIELIVVIAILAILAAILIPVVSGFIEDANIAADTANAKNIYNCAAIYYAAGGDATTQGLLIADADFTAIYGAAAFPAARSGDKKVATVTVTGTQITAVVLGDVTIGLGGAVTGATTAATTT